MDLECFTTDYAERGQLLTLVHPLTKEPLTGFDDQPITMTVMGRDARSYQRKINEIMERRDPAAKVTLQLRESEDIELLSSAVLGWSGNIEIRGERFTEFNLQNVKLVMARVPIIREQVESFIGNRERFWTASSGD